MSTTFTQPPQSTVQYPDDDGQPMSDNTLQFKWIVLIKEGLETLFRHDPNVFVAGDLLWYPEEGKPKIRQAPDVMVVLGRTKGERGSYKQWEEDGIAPQVVFEVLSPGNRLDEMLRKFRFYEKYGVEEYYIYNPDDGSLLGWRRRDGGLEEITEMNGYVSQRLGVRFEPGEGPKIVEKRRVVPRITVVSQVVFSLLFRARTSSHGRPVSILLPEFPMPRLRPPQRRKSHRHRPTRQVPAVSLALLPHLPRPVLRTQGYPAVPRPLA